jgi:hypothetical protein
MTKMLIKTGQELVSLLLSYFMLKLNELWRFEILGLSC